jgi:flagellar motor component MotA
MKRLLGLILLAGVIYGGYVYYRQSTAPGSELTSSVAPHNNLIITQSSGKLANIAAVLGTSIGTTYENGKELLNNATSGKSEPIINELVNKTTETLKDLPRKEAEKIKYEFCRGIVDEYENKSTIN